MKINLPIFKDEYAKDAVTYQSWRWDLTDISLCGMLRSVCSSDTPFSPCKVYPIELVQSPRDGYSLG